MRCAIAEIQAFLVEQHNSVPIPEIFAQQRLRGIAHPSQRTIETLPIEMNAYKVIHHATSNVIEDEDDPTGFFVNEYAIGKAADVFPPDSGRLIKAGSKLTVPPKE